MMRLIIILIIFNTLIGQSLAKNASKLPLYKADQRAARTHSTNDLFKSYLELSSFKHQVLSQNIANVNTPGYEADEVKMPEKYTDLVSGKTNKRIKLAVTSGNHIVAKNFSRNKFASHKLKDPYEIKLNGNNVSLAQQMTKVSQNREDYNAAVKTYATTNSLISSILGK